MRGKFSLRDRYRGILFMAVVGFCAGESKAAIAYVDLYTLGPPAGFNSFNLSGGMQLAGGGQVVGYGYEATGGNYRRAVLWTGSTGNAVDLGPAGYVDSQAYGTSGMQQVGFAGGQAFLWNGTAGSGVDLGPDGFDNSIAYGTDGIQQVGIGSGTPTGGAGHALIWSGSADSVVDLNPGGFTSSAAYGIGGSQQVGYGVLATNSTHALVWSGSAASAVDLNPSGFNTSYAEWTNGTQQVGYGYGTATGGFPHYHALLWSGSTGSAVDLNPSGFGQSYAYGTDGIDQVGYGSNLSTEHVNALLWSGSAGSFIDLESVLPATFMSSYAYSISGNTVYGYAYDTDQNIHAIAWTLTVPEPWQLTVFGISGLGLFRRRKCLRSMRSPCGCGGDPHRQSSSAALSDFR
jgi:hypothetical protein